MTRPDLLTLLAIASGCAPCLPYRPSAPGSALESPTPDEWAAHLMRHAKALGGAVDHELAQDTYEAAARAERAQHLAECQPDTCAAGCPDVVRRREEWATDHERRVMQRLCDAVLSLRDSGGSSLTASFELDMAAESYRALRST